MLFHTGCVIAFVVALLTTESFLTKVYGFNMFVEIRVTAKRLFADFTSVKTLLKMNVVDMFVHNLFFRKRFPTLFADIFLNL